MILYFMMRTPSFNRLQKYKYFFICNTIGKEL
jgi:hypothetical protein